MASPHSGNITFIDLTDSKKVDIHISSNLPTIQIYDANTPKYSPDWSHTPLELTATAYVDSTDITSTLTNDSIKWYRQIGSDTYNEISTGNQKLKISNNELIDENIGWSAGTISYICSIKYNGKSFENKITFARVDTGLNGSDGVDGTGVTILGSYNTLNELHTAHPTGNAGDAYIVDGNLYVWAVDDATWENVGNIKGPAGKDGKDSKNIVLSGDSQVFKVNKSNVITPDTIKITAQAFNTSIASWTYSTNGGRTFLSTAPTGVSRDGNVITIDGSTITSNSITIKASDGEISDIFTVYKAIDGLDGNKGDDGIPAPIAFLTNENITFSSNAQGQISGTTITSNVVAYNGTTKVTPTIGTITGIPTGMTITPSTITASNEIMLTITITNNATLGSASSNMGVISIPITYPVSAVLSLTWSKVNAGANGTSASIVDITPSAYYFKSTTGKNGTFTPEYIYVYPRFQNVTFSKWEYSVDGGVTWVAALGANGLTINTYSSVANTLRIARTSTLYTDTVTSISFRCVSSNAAVYDTVSIAKIYDVVDLEIGGTNLVALKDCGSYAGGKVTIGKFTNITNEQYTFTATNNPTDLIGFIGRKLESGKIITISGKTDLTNMTNYYAFYNNEGTMVSMQTNKTVKVINNSFNFQLTVPIGATIIHLGLGLYPYVSKYTISNVKIENGNKATDWSPAPEDIDANIEKVDTRLTSSLADVKTTTDSISSKVSATEQSITTINGTISSLSTKVSAAEQKITSDAIVSTVRQSTDYINDLGSKVGTTEIISKINQTAETVTISANKIGLLGATNIPDLTADKIKGGTLTLGGSSSTTQNGQLLVKNASNVNMLKVNKDGIVVKSNHLAVAEDFANSTYNWSTNTWTTTTNTRQLDLSHNSIRMGVYSPSGYANYMKLLDDGLYFQGNAQGIGSWGSFIGHDDYGDFVIQDTVRGYIVFKGPDDDTEIANISGSGLSVSGVYSNTITSSANLHIASSGQFYRSTSSSQKYKTDIKDIQSEELNPEKLYDLPVREFKFKEGYLSEEDSCINTLVPGFIAEEVAEVYPIACEYDGDDPENWNMRFIVPAMLKLIQNQKQEIDALKAEIKNIK